MSRFEVDKFITAVEASDDAVRAYVSDPEDFVAGWEERAETSRLPTPDSGRFTDAERVALVAGDHAALYEIGAHPYVLWHFVEAIRVWAGDATWPEMTARYRDDVRHFVTPDFTT